MLKRLTNHQIDKEKWDLAILNADESHVYMLSWYLDIVSPGWECIVFDDYKIIFPLPVKYKYCIPYLVQPLLCQKSGIFGIGVNDKIAKAFYKKIFWEFPYFNLKLSNALGLHKTKYLNGKINYTLDLTADYDILVKDYKKNTLRNIKKAKKVNLFLSECDVNSFLAFGKTYIQGINESEYITFTSLVLKASEKGKTHILKVCNQEGEILAAACFLIWNMQIVYLAGASSPQGKELLAMHLIFDGLIKEYAATGWLLDFEGSMISGVAKFFRGFGGKASYYYHVKKYLFFYR